MQPAPLAGTATKLDNQHLSWLQDATRTPRGDGNRRTGDPAWNRFNTIQPAPLTGTATLLLVDFTSIPLDATRTSRGDGNFSHCQPSCSTLRLRCNPHPSRGRQPTPGNVALKCACRMQPAPLTGTATHDQSSDRSHAHLGCNPHPSRGRQQNLKPSRTVTPSPRMQPAPLAGTATSHTGRY